MKVVRNISLKNLNTFGVDVKSKYFVEIYSEEELKQVLRSEFGMKILDEDSDKVIVEAGAGVIWDELVKYCIIKNFGGIENLSFIPGTVGAAPIQNIGAYGQELEETFYELRGIYIDSCETKNFHKSECSFSYRNSIFKSELKNKFVITSVKLKLNRNPDVNLSYNPVKEEVENRNNKHPTIKDIREIVIDIRKNKLPDPVEIGNAGSFFKNPVITKEKFKILEKEYPDLKYFFMDEYTVKIAAAWLIEKCGWKGKRVGDAGTHEKQPLVIVNYGNASGEEIYEISTMIKNDVKTTFDITLENEVNVL